MIYIFTLLLIIVLNQIWQPSHTSGLNNVGVYYGRNRKKYCITIGIWLLFLLVFRHAYVGSDTQNYFKVFNDIGLYGFSLELHDSELSTEFGFYYLNYLLNKFGLPFRCLIFISASFYIWTISYLIYKYSKSPAISYFIFLTYGYFIFNTTMRQCFALSFCILSFLAIINKHWIKAAVLFCCGILFHSTAVVFIIAFVVPLLKYNRKSLFLIVISGLIILTSATAIFNAASELVGKNYEVMETTGYVSMIIIALFIAYGYSVRYRIPENNRYWMYLLLISIILFPLASLNPALFRIRMYFSVFIIVYAANLLSIKSSYSQLLYSLAIVYGLYSFFIGNYLAGIRVMPYAFYWENYYELNPKVSELGLYPPD